MIERLQRIARIIQKFRWILYLLAVASAIVAVASVIPNRLFPDDRWLMPGVIVLCWALTLINIGRMFESVPPEATREMSWHRWLVRKMLRGTLWVLGLAMIALTFAVLVLSWQLLRVWMMS